MMRKVLFVLLGVCLCTIPAALGLLIFIWETCPESPTEVEGDLLAEVSAEGCDQRQEDRVGRTLAAVGLGTVGGIVVGLLLSADAKAERFQAVEIEA